MAKDFSNFLGPKKKKKINLTNSKSTMKTSSKVVANYEQSVSATSGKVVANYEQTSSKRSTAESKSGSKVVAQPVAQVVANYEQTSSKVVAKCSFFELSGHQRNLIEIIYKSCRRLGSKTSPPLSIEYLSKNAQTARGTVKNAILRLQKKGLLLKANFKNGRGGWTQYQLSEKVYQELLQQESDSKVVANYGQSSSKVVAQPVAQLVASPHSSSKNLNLKNTTTMKNVDNFKLNHNISIPSELNEIGFQESHLDQILRQTTLDEEHIQESLNHYALDLRNGSVRAGYGKLNLIVGVLKKSNAYVSESYISEEQNVLKELAIRSEMLQELKSKQNEIELLKKYKAWKKNLTQEKINELVPPNNIIEEAGTLQDIQLQSYFEKNHFTFIEENNYE